MGGIRTYGPYAVISSGDMSGDLTSTAVDMLSLPYGAIQAEWTGTPTGTFTIQGSIDNVSSASAVTNWRDTGIAMTGPAGGTLGTLLNLSGVGFRWLRIIYTRSSGSGTLNVTIFGKGLG